MTDTAYWTVPVDHAVFAGHFPGSPVLPGVMLLDTALHLIAAATGIALDPCEIRSIKFLSPAHPGEKLVIQHVLTASGTIRFDIVAEEGMRKIAGGTVVSKIAGSVA